MEKKLTLAAIEPFVAPVSGEGVQGANVAGSEYLEALLRFGGDDVERVVFFLGSEADREVFRKTYRCFIENPAFPSIVVEEISQLPDYLKRGEVSSFISSSILQKVFELAVFRSRYGERPVPLTTLIHSVSYSEFMTLYAKFALTGFLGNEGIVCSSNAGKEVLEKCFASVVKNLEAGGSSIKPMNAKLKHIPLGAFTENFGTISRTEARTKLGLPSQGEIVLSLCRFSAYDKMDLLPLLRIAQRHFRENPDSETRFLLAGSRTPNNYLELLRGFVRDGGLEGKILFFPDFQGEEKCLLYAASDIFVSPADNFQETFGITVIEAMASGLPVVVADMNGYRETVVEGETGYRIPTAWSQPGEEMMDVFPLLHENIRHLLLAQGFVVNEEVMYERITELLQNREKREGQGRQAQVHAQQYHWKEIIPRHIGFIRELIAISEGLSQQAKKNIFQISYGEVFDHYCTEPLHGKTMIAVTERGQAILRQQANYSIYGDVAGHLDTGLLRHILFSCREENSVEGVREKVRYKSPELLDKANYHILWLLKQNYLRES